MHVRAWLVGQHQQRDITHRKQGKEAVKGRQRCQQPKHQGARGVDSAEQANHWQDNDDLVWVAWAYEEVTLLGLSASVTGQQGSACQLPLRARQCPMGLLCVP